ncbi:MAG: diguanylate cyclase [Blautia sp.]|nr:diguanylate cyclase [Blautia sp.]
MKSTDGVKKISEGWYRIIDGEKIPVTIPAKMTLDENGSLTLYNDSLTEEINGKVLTTTGAQYSLKIMIGDEVLYEYKDPQFPRNEQMESKLSCDAQFPVQIEDRKLTLVFQKAIKGKIQVSDVYIGTGSAIVMHHFSQAALSVGIEFIMIILGIFSIGVSVYLYYIHMLDKRFIDVAFFLMICAVWLFTDSGLVQTYTNFEAQVCLISFYAFMLLAIPMVHFVRHTGEMAQYKILDICVVAFYMNAIIQGILNYLGVFEFIDMLFVTHLLLGFSAVIAGYLLLKEYRKEAKREIKTIFIAVAVLAFSGILALFLYWILQISYYGVIFQCGILIFVIMILAGIVRTLAENLRFKTEALIYQQLAKEDKLTGLSNRRAFDERIAVIQENMWHYENAALIFMDLNKLKYTNDHFGHSAGDELIVAASRCIVNTFQDKGFCFRIGGDEFCVIIENPSEPSGKWFERLNREIEIYNSRNRYKLSVACGISYLRDKNGNLKTISDWKYEADLAMYENKGGKMR